MIRMQFSAVPSDETTLLLSWSRFRSMNALAASEMPWFDRKVSER